MRGNGGEMAPPRASYGCLEPISAVTEVAKDTPIHGEPLIGTLRTDPPYRQLPRRAGHRSNATPELARATRGATAVGLQTAPQVGRTCLRGHLEGHPRRTMVAVQGDDALNRGIGSRAADTESDHAVQVAVPASSHQKAIRAADALVRNP